MGNPREKVDDIPKHYSSNEEPSRFVTHQLEFLVTSQLLAHYLGLPSSVLELGAGPGTYTLDLARRGHRIVASDLSAPLIEQNRRLLSGEGLDGKVRFLVADARDMEKHVERGFDAITVFGPLYHLTKPAERGELLRSCFRLLKPGGLVISSHLTRLGAIAQTLARYPEMILNPNAGLDEIWKKGHVKSHPRDGSFRGYFTTLEEVPVIHEEAGFQTVALHAKDPCLAAADEIFNRLGPELKMPWAHLLFKISSDIAALGSGRHIAYVGRKPSQA